MSVDFFDLMSSVSEKTQKYLEVLNEEQLEAVIHEGSPLLILAGAGSGKTRVITTKIAYLIAEKHIDPHQILALTFTKKAANEMHERAIALEEKSVYSHIRTFHSFGAWFLRIYPEEADVDPNFTVYDDDDMVTLITKANPKLTRQQATHFTHEISLAKDYCLSADSGRLDEIDSDEKFKETYALYEKRLRETGNVDFGDLIMRPYFVLKENERVRFSVHDRFKVILVDEYQDSNVAQYLLLQELCGVNEGSGNYVCVVGDDDQSIYKFRGAEIQNILTFAEKFPGTKIVRLEKNYRSTNQILKIADNVVRNNSGRLGKTLVAERGEGKIPVLAFLPNQDEEAEFCGDLIRKSVENGANYSDWAILYRTNAQSLTFESVFLNKRIPYAVVGSLKFYEREEIKDLLAFLALIANPKDEIAFRRIVNKPARGIGATTQEKIISQARTSPSGGIDFISAAKEYKGKSPKKTREGISSFVELIETLKDFITAKNDSVTMTSELAQSAVSDSKPESDEEKLSVFIEMISEKSGLKEYHESQDEISGTQRVQNLQELANSAVLYPCSMPGLLEFLDHIELDRTIDNPDEDENPNKVTLITLHNTKGLEFNRVIMTGMEYGIFPRTDKSPEEMEEERRLCYVGITRARDELYLTSCSLRRMYGRTEYMQISPFLLEIGKEFVKAIGNQPSSYKRSGFHGGDFGKNGLSNPDVTSDETKSTYAKGVTVYHDDYGYGVISATATDDEGEYRITVTFENSGVKKFLPKYQGKSLMVVKE